MKLLCCILGACLLATLLSLVRLAVSHTLLRRQLRRFTEEVTRRKDSDYHQPLKIDAFDRDIVPLANALNAHVAIQQALAEQYRADRTELSDIVSGISHDFRTPLTATLGYLQMIEKSGALHDKNSEYLAIAMEKNEYLKQLSDDFFALSKLDHTTEALSKERLCLTTLVSEAILEQYDWISSRGIQTLFSVADGVFVESDAHALQRILDNLFSNARKYTSSTIHVTLTAENDSALLCMETDPEEGTVLDVSRVFEPFYRADARSKNGSGLGLYVVKCLADHLGATVSVSLSNGFFVIALRL